MDPTLPMNSIICIMHLQRPIIRRLASISSSMYRIFLRDVYIRHHELQCVYIYIYYFFIHFFHKWINYTRFIAFFHPKYRNPLRPNRQRGPAIWPSSALLDIPQSGSPGFPGNPQRLGNSELQILGIMKNATDFFRGESNLMQMYGSFEGFPLNSVVFGLVI